MAELPPGQTEHATLTIVDDGGGAVIAAAAALLAALMPDAVAMLAIEGMAEDGQVKDVCPPTQVSQGTTMVDAGITVTVMVGGGVREASAFTFAADAAVTAAGKPETAAIFEIADAACDGQANVVVLPRHTSQGSVIVCILTGGAIGPAAAAALLAATDISFEAADWAAATPVLVAIAPIDDAAVAGHAMVVTLSGQT